MNIVAIIPARGGSKGIPGKNIKKFYGKPLIAWAIEAGLKSNRSDRVIVSTDDIKIARLAKKYGAEVPFLRPPSLARSSTPVEQVMQHVIKELWKRERYKTDIVILLLPTNPFRQPFHIDEAVQLFLKRGIDCVVSVSSVPAAHNPFWVFRTSPSNPDKLINAKDQHIGKVPLRRQLLPPSYAKNDVVFVSRAANLLKNPPTIYGRTQALYLLGEEYDVDINTPEEWFDALIKFHRFKRGGR